MPLEINAQFNRFVQFAQGQKNDLAIARKGDAIAGEGALAGRAITAAVGDKVGAVRRSAPDRTKNDETRALFRQSVVRIFGGEEMIPASVKESMELGDGYDTRGKPLTARSILTVQKAIARFMAAESVDYAVEFINAMLQKPSFRVFRLPALVLASKQRNAAIRTAAKFAKDLNENVLRLVAACAAVAAARGHAPNAARENAKAFAPVRGIFPNDESHAETERRELLLAQEELEECLSEKIAGLSDPDGVSENFRAGATHGIFAIDGKEFNQDPKAVEEFKAKIKPEHRKALSFFLGREGDSAVEAMLQRIFPGDSPFAFWAAGNGNPKHSLEIAGDGKSATVTLETPAFLKFGFKDEGADAAYPVGGIAWKQEFVFDLSGPEAVLAATRIGQDLEA